MVAYSFQKQFAPAIYTSKKRQTIRAHRKRHARPTEMLQLYEGMRTTHCAKIIADQLCLYVLPITILVTAPAILRITVDGADECGDLQPWQNHEEFAKLDGFASLENMHTFWLMHHGIGVFSGVLIGW